MTEGEFEKRIGNGYTMMGKVSNVVKAKEVLRMIDDARKELEKGFIADKANFTSYKSYLKFLEWFGDKKDEENK